MTCFGLPEEGDSLGSVGGGCDPWSQQGVGVCGGGTLVGGDAAPDPLVVTAVHLLKVCDQTYSKCTGTNENHVLINFLRTDKAIQGNSHNL